MAARQKVKCTHCDVLVDRTKIAFHIRNFHGPGSSNRNAPVAAAQQPQPPAEMSRWNVREAPPAPDVQEDRKSFKLNIQSIVCEFDTLPGLARQECSDSVGNLPVLGALYAYTFTHLKLCDPNKRSLLDDLDNLKAGWIREGDACLLDLKTMKDGLVHILRRSQVRRHICNTRLIDDNRLHELDINYIVTLIAEHTMLEGSAHVFYAMVDDKAQYMVDTLQNLLVLQSECIESYRGYLLNALMRLSRKSGRFPLSLQLRQIQDLTVTNFEGGFGDISQGKLNGRIVAVKMLKVGSRTTQQCLKDLCNEAVVWRHAQHQNCLPFYGVYVLEEDSLNITLCLVSPWMENGHARHYLQANPLTDRLPLILDVACGLEFLHSMQPRIIHGDLKGANILVTSSGRACLADFGIAIVRDSHGQMTTTMFNGGGAVNFMAPELLRLEPNFDVKNLDKCDMYAFGCVCYEMYTGMAPFQPTPSPNVMVLVLDRQRPERPTDSIQELDDFMWGFIESLWNHDAGDRPTAAEACEWVSSKMASEGKNTVRPATEVEWDVRFLANAAVTMGTDDLFALAHT